MLAEAFLRNLAAEHKKTLTFSKKALEAMETYTWPGNVRELENKLKRAVIMATEKQITQQDLSLAGPYAGISGHGTQTRRGKRWNAILIERAIARNRGNLTKCADELQIARSSLYELIDKLGIARK